jgi:hypothetical protein
MAQETRLRVHMTATVSKGKPIKVRKHDAMGWAVVDGNGFVMFDGISLYRSIALDRFLCCHKKTRKEWRDYFRKTGFTLERVRIRFDAA